MSQADVGDASSATLGKKNLSRLPRGRAGARDRSHVLGRPRPRRGLAPGHRRRLERGARSPARRARRGRDRVHDLALCPEVRRRGRCVRVPHARGAPVGRRAHVRHLLRRCALPRAAAASTSASGSSPTTSGRPHISHSGPAWWVWGMIALGIVLLLNYLGVRLAIRAMLAFAALSFVPMLILALVIIVKGGEGGNTLSMFNPGETSVFGVTGGGVLGGILLGILLFVGFEAAASIGEESEDPHRSIPARAGRNRRRRGGLLRGHGVRVLDRLRAEGRQRGRVGVLARAGQRDGDEVRRIVVRHDSRARRDPRRDGACTRDLRHDRPRLLRART